MLHKPEAGLTVQLGLGGLLADFTRCPVIYDLRAADVAAGGQGAPLVPAYHRAVTAKLPSRPIAIVNIGGVSNVTWVGRNGDLIAFDTGPGNALLDDWMMRRTGSRFDHDGLTAGRGRVDEEIRPVLSGPRLFRCAAAEVYSIAIFLQRIVSSASRRRTALRRSRPSLL